MFLKPAERQEKAARSKELDYLRRIAEGVEALRDRVDATNDRLTEFIDAIRGTTDEDEARTVEVSSGAAFEKVNGRPSRQGERARGEALGRAVMPKDKVWQLKPLAKDVSLAYGPFMNPAGTYERSARQFKDFGRPVVFVCSAGCISFFKGVFDGAPGPYTKPDVPSYLHVDPSSHTEHEIVTAAEMLGAGGMVVLPTNWTEAHEEVAEKIADEVEEPRKYAASEPSPGPMPLDHYYEEEEDYDPGSSNSDDLLSVSSEEADLTSDEDVVEIRPMRKRLRRGGHLLDGRLARQLAELGSRRKTRNRVY